MVVFVLSGTPTVAAAPADYDANGNGTIERDEVVLAIRDYFADLITRDEVVEVIRYYFTGDSVGAVPELKLSALSLTHGDPAVTVALMPAFEPATSSYTADVANDVSSVTVTATPIDPTVAVVIKIGGTEDPDGTVELSEGSNVIEVEVTAADGVNSRTYTVTVVREAPPVVNLRLDVSDHQVAGYWADGTADIEGTITLTVEGGGNAVSPKPVEVTCADDDGMRPELCSWRADLLDVGLATASTDFRMRVPMGFVTLVFTYGGINSDVETLEREVYVPLRIVGVSREEWDCYVDRTLDTSFQNAFGTTDFYGCSGWRSTNQVEKLAAARPIVLWATGDERYIDILRESIDELSPILNHDIKWTSKEAQSNFKAYVGIPGKDWADYGLTRITPELLGTAGFARGITKATGEVVPQDIVVWRLEREWTGKTPTLAKSIIVHELMHALTGVSHVSTRVASIVGNGSNLPKLSPVDKVLFGINSHSLVKPGMSLKQVSDLVVFDEDLLDESPADPDALDLLWGAAIQLVDSGAVRFHLSGGWIGDCDKPFGTTSNPAILDIGNFGGFLRIGAYTARYQDASGTYWMGLSEEDSEWRYWIQTDGSLKRVSYETVANALLWRLWPSKLQGTLYALISHWDQEDVEVTRQEDTVTLKITFDESYESLWNWEPGLSLEFTIVVDAETHEIVSYTWNRSHPLPRYCDTYEEVAQAIDLGVDFAVPVEVAAADSRGDAGRPPLFERNSPVIPEIKLPKAP